MSSQSPYDPSGQQMPPTQYGQYAPQPGQASEYVPPAYTPQAGYTPINPYEQQPVYGYPVLAQPERGRGQAIAGMVLGIISMVAWLLPFLGVPTAVVGLILSILGRRAVSRKGMALAGIILSSIALVLALCNAGLGAYMAIHR